MNYTLWLWLVFVLSAVILTISRNWVVKRYPEQTGSFLIRMLYVSLYVYGTLFILDGATHYLYPDRTDFPTHGVYSVLLGWFVAVVLTWNDELGLNPLRATSLGVIMSIHAFITV